MSETRIVIKSSRRRQDSKNCRWIKYSGISTSHEKFNCNIFTEDRHLAIKYLLENERRDNTILYTRFLKVDNKKVTMQDIEEVMKTTTLHEELGIDKEVLHLQFMEMIED